MKLVSLLLLSNRGQSNEYVAHMTSNVQNNYTGTYRPRTRNYDRSFVHYEFCKIKGHTKDNCYKLHGYPTNFKYKKKGGFPNTYANNAVTSGNMISENQGFSESNTSILPPYTGSNTILNGSTMPVITQKQYSQLLYLLKGKESEPMANTIRLSSETGKSGGTTGTSTTTGNFTALLSRLAEEN